VPIYFENDRQSIDVALDTIGAVSARMSKIVRIKNTLRLDIVAVSEAYTEALNGKKDVEILKGPESMEFDHNHNLLPL